MRAIGTVPTEQDSRRFGSYLLTLGISSQMDATRDGYCVWVRDEDHVERARQELAAFVQNPTDPRYVDAEQTAELVRKRQAQAEKQYRQNVRDIRARWARPSPASCPLTLGLMAVCLAVGAASRLGREREGFLNYLSMTRRIVIDGQPYVNRTLPEIRRGEVWRLVTPIFVHFGVLHLVFNLWCLYNLGGVIEIHRGWWRLALLVLSSAIVSNLAQWYFRGPAFGGMSGVIYALLGYAWMKSRFEPSVGLYVAPDTLTIMIGWLILCMVPGLIPNIANHAHVAGLIVGVVVGVAPTLIRRIWRQLIR